MNSILVISSQEKTQDILKQMLNTVVELDAPVTTAQSAAQAKEMLVVSDYEIVIICAPLIDQFGHELAIEITNDKATSVIMIVKEEVSDEVCSRVESFGVLVVTKPLHKALFAQAVKFALASRNRLRNLENKNKSLKEKIDEIRLVDRAKCILIQYLKMTEQQAHRYIEKQAMDMRLTKKEVALDILKTYEF